VVSPVLSNIYLHRLDAFVETVLIPQYARGTRRAANPAYKKIENAIARARKRGDRTTVRQLRQRQRSLPSRNPDDPGFRRLKYVRYADDHLLGFIGPKAEAEEIKQRLAAFLRDDLALELNQDKTLITHARTQSARFLGYEIIVQHGDSKLTGDRRMVNGKIGLRVPRPVITAKCAPYLRRGKPAHRSPLVNRDDHDIVAIYGAEYRGIAQYYLLAGDVYRLRRLEWVMKTSMLKTLAAKHRSTVSEMAARHKAVIETPHGPRTCFEVRVERNGRKPLVARFGGIPLKRQKNAVLSDPRSGPGHLSPQGTDPAVPDGTVRDLQAKDTMEMHHVRKLADLGQPGPDQPAWAKLMAKMRRKALVVCIACHAEIHAGQHTATATA
jgi:hypothetical protein